MSFVTSEEYSFLGCEVSEAQHFSETSADSYQIMRSNISESITLFGTMLQTSWPTNQMTLRYRRDDCAV
jgi:hypothetical protein